MNEKFIKRMTDFKLKYYLEQTKLKIKDTENLIRKYDISKYEMDLTEFECRMYMIYKNILYDLYKLKDAYEDEIEVRKVSDKNLENWINDI